MISDFDGKCTSTGMSAYEQPNMIIEDYMAVCKDNLGMCQSEELRRDISPYNKYVNDE